MAFQRLSRRVWQRRETRPPVVVEKEQIIHKQRATQTKGHRQRRREALESIHTQWMKLRRLIDSNLVHDDQVTRRAPAVDALRRLAQKIAYARVPAHAINSSNPALSHRLDAYEAMYSRAAFAFAVGVERLSRAPRLLSS